MLTAQVAGTDESDDEIGETVDWSSEKVHHPTQVAGKDFAASCISFYQILTAVKPNRTKKKRNICLIQVFKTRMFMHTKSKQLKFEMSKISRERDFKL